MYFKYYSPETSTCKYSLAEKQTAIEENTIALKLLKVKITFNFFSV